MPIGVFGDAAGRAQCALCKQWLCVAEALSYPFTAYFSASLFAPLPTRRRPTKLGALLRAALLRVALLRSALLRSALLRSALLRSALPRLPPPLRWFCERTVACVRALLQPQR